MQVMVGVPWEYPILGPATPAAIPAYMGPLGGVSTIQTDTEECHIFESRTQHCSSLSEGFAIHNWSQMNQRHLHPFLLCLHF